MDKLSELLNEAKPLYKTRKRNKTMAKMILVLSLPLFISSAFIGLNNLGDEVYISMSNNSLQEEFLGNDFGL